MNFQKWEFLPAHPVDCYLFFVTGDSEDEDIIEDEADGPNMRTASIRHIGGCNRIRVCY